MTRAQAVTRLGGPLSNPDPWPRLNFTTGNDGSCGCDSDMRSHKSTDTHFSCTSIHISKPHFPSNLTEELVMK